MRVLSEWILGLESNFSRTAFHTGSGDDESDNQRPPNGHDCVRESDTVR